MNADGRAALIGAPAAAADTGAAYLFTRGLVGGWSLQQQLQAGGPGDRFGEALSLSLDEHTALIGAPRTGQNAGAVHVFARGIVGGFTRKQTLQGADGEGFGLSTALDRFGLRALIGAPGHELRGAAYGFVRTLSGTFTRREVLEADGGAPGDAFGLSVALSSDGPVSLIGAPISDQGRGAAYVFSGGPG